MARRERRGPPLFGLLFVALGVVLLLLHWFDFGKFWPVVLILLGLLLTGSILGAALLAESDASVRVDRIEEPLLSTRSLDLGMGFGAGSLVIDSLPRGSSNLVEGWFEAACGSASTSFQRYDGTAALDVDVSVVSPSFPVDGAETGAYRCPPSLRSRWTSALARPRSTLI